MKNVDDKKKFYSVCPVCGGAHQQWRVKQSGNDVWPIDQCTVCGFAFANPRPSIDFLMNFYQNTGHASQVGSVVAKVESLETVVEREKLEPNSSIDAKRVLDTLTTITGLKEGDSSDSVVKHFLDVGCGYGFFSKAAQSRGYQVTSIELAKTERAIATQMLGVQPIASSFEAFSGESGKFSVVLMSQILEHALDFNDWIVKAKGLLKENGHLVIALPNFGSIFRYLMQEREPYICPPAHINFFNTRSLSVLLQKHGFQVVERQWITRIPKSALRSRFGDLMGTSLVPFSKIAASAIDSSHLGMMINIYAQKV